MLWLALVTVYEFAAEFTVGFMKVQAESSAKKGNDLFNVLTYFCYVAGTAGVVTRGLDAAGEGFIALKTDDIISLPAVQGDRSFLQYLNSLVSIYT